MLYLEDYMEMIENLPMEMRDRFTEMREMDLQVQNAMDSLEDRLKGFFKKCETQPNLTKEWKDDQYNQIREGFQKVSDDADEKVQMATQLHGVLERYHRKLDQEVTKFKMELEADSAGITEMLEKRSLELDRPPPTNNHRGEKRKYSSMMSGGSSNSLEKRHANNTPTSSLLQDHKDHLLTSTGSFSIASLATREPMAASSSSSLSRCNSAAPSPGLNMFSSSGNSTIAAAPVASASCSSVAAATATPALSYSLGHVGAGSNAAIAAAAQRAIGATIEMQQGRRTASLKASYDAVQRHNQSFAAPSPYPQQQQQQAGPSTSGGYSTPAGADQLPPPPPTTKLAKKKSRAQQQAARQAAVQAAAAAAGAAAQQQVSGYPQVEHQSALASVLQGSSAGAGAGAGDGGIDVGGAVGGALAGSASNDGSTASWQYDPNEPRYCTCNDISHGEMVGCDNNDCPIEWFHYQCVGLVNAPKGKWFCPQCTAAMKRRGRK